MAEVMSAGEAKGFYDEATKQLAAVETGEPLGIDAALVGAVSGMPFVLLGPVGGGKSSIIESIPNLLRDVRDDQTVFLPPLSDMAPQRVVGGDITTVTEIDEGDSRRRETKTVGIEALIPTDVVTLLLDEINRGSMTVNNALLRTLENKQLLSTVGRINLPELLIIASTMNQSENRNHAVLPVSPAVASRHAIGARVGEKSVHTPEIIDLMLDDPEPVKVDQIADIFQFLQLREHAKRDLAIPETLKPAAIKAIEQSLEMMDGIFVEQAAGRFARQIGRIARVHAALTGEKVVEPANIKQALLWGVTAKVGMLSTRKATDDALAKADQILVDTMPRSA
ncbi:MAG: AAA family ATPase [Patescibacteria group bacterium]